MPARDHQPIGREKCIPPRLDNSQRRGNGPQENARPAAEYPAQHTPATRPAPTERIAEGGQLHPVQQAFIDYGGFQCGICTPGQVIAAKSLLDLNPTPTEDEIREWMMGNLCRCTGYYGILESVINAARTVQEQGR